MEMSEFLNICNETRSTEASKRLSEMVETEKENREIIAKSYRTIARILRDPAFWMNASMITSSRLLLVLTHEGIKLFEDAVGNINPVFELKGHQWNVELAGCKLYNVTSRSICIEANGLEASLDNSIQKIVIECCEKGGTDLNTIDQHILMQWWN